MDELPSEITLVLTPFGCKIVVEDFNISIENQTTREIVTDKEKLIHMLRTLADLLENNDIKE